MDCRSSLQPLYERLRRAGIHVSRVNRSSGGERFSRTPEPQRNRKRGRSTNSKDSSVRRARISPRHPQTHSSISEYPQADFARCGEMWDFGHPQSAGANIRASARVYAMEAPSASPPVACSSRGIPRLATAAGVSTTDGTLAILATGSLTLEVFRGIIANIPDGTWEFVCHPGYDDDALRATGTRLRTSRQRELERPHLSEIQRGVLSRNMESNSFPIASPEVAHLNDSRSEALIKTRN